MKINVLEGQLTNNESIALRTSKHFLLKCCSDKWRPDILNILCLVLCNDEQFYDVPLCKINDAEHNSNSTHL